MLGISSLAVTINFSRKTASCSVTLVSGKLSAVIKTKCKLRVVQIKTLLPSQHTVAYDVRGDSFNSPSNTFCFFTEFLKYKFSLLFR